MGANVRVDRDPCLDGTDKLVPAGDARLRTEGVGFWFSTLVII